MMEIINEYLSFKGAAAIAVLLSVIQISPIKISPWSYIGRTVGRFINGEVIEKVGRLEKDIKDIRHEIGEDRADTERARILSFNGELLEGKRHTKAAFDQCLTDVDNYERYCSEHPEYKNNMTAISVQNIKRCYENCLKQHDFL